MRVPFFRDPFKLKGFCVFWILEGVIELEAERHPGIVVAEIDVAKA